MKKQVILGLAIALVIAVGLLMSGCGKKEAKTLKGELSQLTTDNSLKWSGSWSPDGHWIVYSAQTDERQFGIWKVNVHTRDTIQLTQFSEEASLPQWSPKGDVIAFVRAGDIWTIDPNGKHQKQVTHKGDLEGFIVWDLNGKYLYVHYGRVSEGWAISRINIATGALEEVMNHKDTYMQILGISGIRRGGGFLCWAFNSKGCWLYEIDTASKSLTPIIHPPLLLNRKKPELWLTNPSPSPDGSYIVYQDGIRADSGIWVVKSDGTDKQCIISHNKIRPGASSPLWSPDTTKIAFLRFEPKLGGAHDLLSQIWLFTFDQENIDILRKQGRVGAMSPQERREKDDTERIRNSRHAVGPGWKIYQNDEYSFQFYYPKGWEKFPSEYYPPGVVVAFSVLRGPNMNVVVESSRGMSLEEYVVHSRKMLQPEGIELSEGKYLMVNGRRAYEWTATTEMQGIRFRQKGAILVASDNAYIMTCTVPENAYSLHEDIFNKIINSIIIYSK